MRMVELSERLGLTRQAISSFEKGVRPKPETLIALARHLEVEPSFFTLPLRTREEESSLQSVISFRTLASSAKRERDRAGVYLQWLAGLADLIEEHVELPPVQVPDFGIEDAASLTEEQIEGFASQTRRALGLGDGPIPDLALLLENKGVIIGYVPLAAGMDGISAWINGRPFVLINSQAFAARARLDLAHELAHLLLHRVLTPEDLESKGLLRLIEDQAQQFAGCFLLPERTFIAEMYGVDDATLLAAKKRWGVSMQAIVMRMHALGLINESQKTRIFVRFSEKGYRRKEPLDNELKPERSRLLKRAIEFLQEHQRLQVWELFDRAKYPAWLIEHFAGVKNVIAPPANVVQFRLRSA
jgi:Zn-dependent peptidase ImmA (M78 family)/transcriptional regulator with XRE-family HTH domain